MKEASDNPLHSSRGSMESPRKSLFEMREQKTMQDVANIRDAFSKSRIDVSQLDISLAKAMRNVSCERVTPRELWSAYDHYAEIDEWCQVDQIRMISLDFLFRRYLSFHNNRLTHRVTGLDEYIKWLPPYEENLDAVAFETQRFNKDKPYEPFRQTTFFHLKTHLNLLNERKDDFLWLHMVDIRSLDEISLKFRLHKYARRFFLDMRCHSSVSAFQDGFFASVMTVRILCSEAHLFKIYYFCTNQMLITFEREVLQDSSNKRIRMKSHVASPEMPFSILSSAEIMNERDDMLVQAFREEIRTSDNRILDALNVYPLPHGVVSTVMGKCGGELYESVCNGGSMFLFYEILMQSLVASESVLEFMSRSMTYFKSQVYKKLSTEYKKNFFRENATLKSNAHMMVALVDDSLCSIHAMMDKTTIEFDFVGQKMMNSWEATLCVAELEDSFRYRKSCLEAQLSECEVLAKSLEHHMDLTSERESMNLNLVATIFLPLTFLAGVFGMNFQVDGGYTMDILNKEKGPQLFWALCIICVVINVIAFIREGLIDFFHSSGNSFKFKSKDEAFDRSVAELKQKIRVSSTHSSAPVRSTMGTMSMVSNDI